MKRVIIVLFAILMLSSCGVGSYSVSSGKADEGMLSFVSASETSVDVTIDDNSYAVYTVKSKAWRKDRNIKKTAKNTIILSPGQHNVIVTMKGKTVLNKKIFVSPQEHKIIEL